MIPVRRNVQRKTMRSCCSGRGCSFGNFWLITSTEMFYVFLSVGWSHCACRSKAYPRPCLQRSAGRICGVDDAVGEYCYSVLIFRLLSAVRFVCFALVPPLIGQLRSDCHSGSDWSGRGHPPVIQEVRNAFHSMSVHIPLSFLLDPTKMFGSF